MMKNYLLSEAIGDIAGSVYESRYRRTKNYDAVKVFDTGARFTDDTVLTFACAEALLDGRDPGEVMHIRGRYHLKAGFGHATLEWLLSDTPRPCGSNRNGAAMRCSAAGWLAASREECIDMATRTALPTHNHPEGVKGAVATALATWLLRNGADKYAIREEIINRYYPQWAGKGYADILPGYRFDVTCEGTVGPAVICFIESTDYLDCIRKAIALGGDADTLAAIAGPMAYAYYGEMPEDLVDTALELLPGWMIGVSARFDERMNGGNRGC